MLTGQIVTVLRPELVRQLGTHRRRAGRYLQRRTTSPGPPGRCRLELDRIDRRVDAHGSDRLGQCHVPAVEFCRGTKSSLGETSGLC